MKTATELKHFFRDRLGIKGVRVKTGTGKGLWQSVWIPYDRIEGNNLVYSQTIPLDFRVACLKIIYPTLPSCWSGTAGNVKSHSIAMHQHEWEKVIAEWEQRLTPAAAVVN